MDAQKLNQQLNEAEGLSWLPWVGVNYLSAPPEKRLLIIGESHYYEGGEAGKAAFSDKHSTRKILQQYAIQADSAYSRFFSNIRKVLVGNESITPVQFWNKVAFYNFIQTPMETKKGRPTSGDFNTGWKTFFNLLPILQPQTCLFIGVLSSYQYNDYRENEPCHTEKMIRGERIGSTYARETVIKDQQQKQTNLHFIKHTSARFSCSNWNEYLVNKMQEQMNWLSSL